MRLDHLLSRENAKETKRDLRSTDAEAEEGKRRAKPEGGAGREPEGSGRGRYNKADYSLSLHYIVLRDQAGRPKGEGREETSRTLKTAHRKAIKTFMKRNM